MAQVEKSHVFMGEDNAFSQRSESWEEIYASLDKAGFPDDFLADRQQGPAQDRNEL